MKLKINPEFAMRHLFVTLLMAALCLWFGYDGFVRYPSMQAEDLFELIEGIPPHDGIDIAAFKQQKIKTQYGFAILALFATLAVGSNLLKVWLFDFSFDDQGFCHNKRRHSYASIREIDRSKWEAKGIIRINRISLDAWHHLGVKEFVEKLDSVKPE